MMTPQPIREFMWGFQPHFRAASRLYINEALLRIGLPAAPEVLLVGFRETAEGPNPICVEPEGGPYPSALLVDAVERAEEALEARPDRDILITDQRLRESRLRACRENARRAAIEAALRRSSTGTDRYFFAGLPARVADYRVYPVVAVLKTQWDDAPTLPSAVAPAAPAFADQSYPQSLQHAVVRVALGEMTMALSMSSEPEGLRTWTSALVPETVRSAADLFVRGIVASCGDASGGDLFNAMTAVSAQPYEGRTGVGTLLLGEPKLGELAVDVQFKVGISLSETRALRKALEMTGVNLALLTDGDVATGLGHLPEGESDDGFFAVTVTGRGQWSLGTTSLSLLSVDNGDATLPRDRLSRATFLDTVHRVFGGAADGRALWDLTVKAAEQQHGTMLVVRADAAEEAERLAPQALLIAPRHLDVASLTSLTAIDGAILVDPSAKCHAVGVILDGRAAAGVGDPSRGARYNSAVRYHEGAAQGTTLIVIVSEDGMINLLPNLRRRVARDTVEKAISDLTSASAEPVNFEQAAKASAHVRSLAFYLSTQQADAANAAFEAIEQARERSLGPGETGITRVGYDQLKPHPKMDESYFLDDLE